MAHSGGIEPLVSFCLFNDASLEDWWQDKVLFKLEPHNRFELFTIDWKSTVLPLTPMRLYKYLVDIVRSPT